MPTMGIGPLQCSGARSMADSTNAPTLQPDPERIEILSRQAAALIANAGVAASILKIHKGLEEGPGEHVAHVNEDQWRTNMQGALSELQQQVLQVGTDDDSVNLTALSEAAIVADWGVQHLVEKVADAAFQQARLVAMVERHRVEEAISPRPPAPGLTQIERTRVKVGNAIWVAGDHMGALAERCGLVVGKALRFPLQRIGGLIVGEVEL
jgi:hypothetical protein